MPSGVSPLRSIPSSWKPHSLEFVSLLVLRKGGKELAYMLQVKYVVSVTPNELIHKTEKSFVIVG